MSEETDRLRAALREAEAVLALVERPAFKDPQHQDAINALGDRIGYGALMAGASARWHELQGGGCFVAGPCLETVQCAVRIIRDALS